MSGIFRTEVIKTDRRSALNLLRENNVPLLVADMAGKNVFDMGERQKFCLAVGNEGNGISDFFADNADETTLVTIPYASCINYAGTPLEESSSIVRVYRTVGAESF